MLQGLNSTLHEERHELNTRQCALLLVDGTRKEAAGVEQ
jgi:hypothetical protein